MKDLISRQAAIEAIDAVFPVDPMKSEYAQGIACGAALAKTYVEQLPPAQSERQKGQWEGTLLVKNSGRVKCSECYAIYDWDTQAQYFKYCPNCGADMRGAERREDG